MLLEKFGEGIEQGAVGFLNAKVHWYRHPQGKDNLDNLSHILHLYLARFAPVPTPPTPPKT